MQALQLQYGQPHQLAQSETAAILTAPEVKPNDALSFQSFTLRAHLLVSMLLSLEGPRGMELNCCSHVDCLLSKATQPAKAWYLPHHLHHDYNSEGKYPGLQQIVHQSFHVDNCLTSFPMVSAAKQTVDQLCRMLAEGGFDLRQWASSHPAVVAHLPSAARSSATEQWLMQNRNNPMEPTLGLRWNCATDTLCYHYRPIEHTALTMKAAYQVLASQYDPLGFILPFTTREKVIIQQLWAKKRDWDDPDLPPKLQTAWTSWESELAHLSKVSIPRCHLPASTTAAIQHSSLHVFCDASEMAYGAVAYLAVNLDSDIHVSFIMARSGIAPKRQQSMPRLELCAGLAGAQLAKVVRDELTLSISQTILWTDSMTVLEWIQSDSCRYKVFIGT
ncbi:3-dehydroquinate synthase [Labeo rohita]|uniref:3-dehydroquinate synthase n=1 Tax=Labeo rohita TaxID=84645 RepID=A0ABQ8LQB2_LABRO|nr:3-dehydroquinate synthase [Labeo rohita]